MIKQVIYNFTGANQDVSRSKHPTQFYYEAGHIRLLATDSQSSASLSNEKGNDLVFQIPSISIDQGASRIIYGDKFVNYSSGGDIDQQINDNLLPITSDLQVIIGHSTTRDSIILFSTDDQGVDCIWELKGVLNGNYDFTLLYVRNINLSTEHLIQTVYNYENENIEKIYWVDGVNQIKSINIVNPDIINEPSNNLNFVGEVNFSQPEVVGSSGGGTHTSGMIQYAYNLYRLNGSQTKLSPLSELYPLDKGASGGGEVNEVVGTVPIVEINDIDTRYSNIKIYAIKYSSYNQIPSVSLIDERELNSPSIKIYDDGSTIETLSLEQFIFLGSSPSIPKHIASKDNRLFVSNLKDKSFILPDELDMRAYAHNSSGNAVVYDNVSSAYTGTMLNVDESTYGNVPYTWDAVNRDYNVYKFQKNGFTLGGEGKFLKYSIVQKSLSRSEDYRLLKDGEIYRIGIQFYNRLGQTSLPKWTADFRTPDGNLENNFNTLHVELKPEFYNWLDTYEFESEDDKPVGYKILRANRTESDKTIITQGIISPMMINFPVGPDEKSLPLDEKRSKSEEITKQPNFLLRTFETIAPLQSAGHLKEMQFTNGTPGDIRDGTDAQNPETEIQHDPTEKRSLSYQFNAMYQMYSPEAMFASLSLSAGLQFRIKGGLKSTANEVWFQRRDIETLLPDQEAKAVNGVSTGFWGYDGHFNPATVTVIQGTRGNFQDRGLIYNPNGNNDTSKMAFTQWYRQFNTFISSSSTGTGSYKRYIYGSPEITERGAGEATYNNDSKLKYKNSLEGILSDGEDHFKDDQLPIVSVNSWGAKAITIVLGDNNARPHQRTMIEQLYTSSGLGDPSVALSAEIVLNDDIIYGGNIYGGNSYEDKKRTEYIEIGDYRNITESSIQIDNAGDTYVQKFKFIRISKTNTEIYQYNVNQLTEIVEYPVETTVDLKNRNDISKSNWDTTFQPRYDDYHKYNRVYSQEPTLIQTTDTDFTFKRVRNFDTRIQSTSLKIPNETIDSWTNLLPNETMDLDGKYGPINNIVNFNDNIYSFQDEGIAAISVNPRVQVQGNDGVAIELGTGGILYDYNYITDKSGSINKWGIYSGKKGIYYYDALNKAVGRVPDATSLMLTDMKGLHTFFNNNHNYDMLKVDNPVKASGALIGGDNYNNDIFITLLQGDQTFNWCYNEALDQFIDLKKGYTPSRYIYKGEKLLIPSPTNNNLYEQYKGDYNKFFDEYNPSYVILQVNPNSNLDCVFTNILYKSELYLDDIDQPNTTLSHIEAYNEYQKSGRIPLVLGRNKNLRRKFRKWQAEIPREAGTRNRIRNPWIFLKLELDNKSNYKLILHDVIVNYIIY